MICRLSCDNSSQEACVQYVEQCGHDVKHFMGNIPGQLAIEGLITLTLAPNDAIEASAGYEKTSYPSSSLGDTVEEYKMTYSSSIVGAGIAKATP